MGDYMIGALQITGEHEDEKPFSRFFLTRCKDVASLCKAHPGLLDGVLYPRIKNDFTIMIANEDLYNAYNEFMKRFEDSKAHYAIINEIFQQAYVFGANKSLETRQKPLLPVPEAGEDSIYFAVHTVCGSLTGCVIESLNVEVNNERFKGYVSTANFENNAWQEMQGFWSHNCDYNKLIGFVFFAGAIAGGSDKALMEKGQ